jgi:antagonist of KipI
MVQVIKKGVFTTLQTLPVSGWRSYGVSPRGPMDIFAHSMVNQVLGNSANAAVMEMHFPAAKLQFTLPCGFTLGGGDFGAVLNEQPIPLWKPVEAMPGDVLRFTGIKKGFRTYLGVQGGFDIPLSRYGNEAVQDNAVLPIGKVQKAAAVFASEATIQTIYSPENQLNCMAGPEYDWLSDDSKEQLTTTPFTISPAGNRMGLPLQGTAQQRVQDDELLSGPVTMGTVQLLPSGQCTVLMADHNTTGGYPRIITVLASELPKLAQLQPGQPFRFKLVDTTTATQQYLRFVQQLNIQPWQ